MVHRRQQLQVVAEAVEDIEQQVEVDGRHLGSQNGVAFFLHLLGEHRTGKFRRRPFALPEAFDHFRRGLFRERGRHDGAQRGIDGRVGHQRVRVD